MTMPEYIKKYKDCAIEQMLVYNIPASVTLAQGILESKCGNSSLAKYANNHFGIKCHDDWVGPYYVYDDDARGEHFRKYTTADESYKDHAEFLKSRPWYTFLFDYARTDYRDWADGLENAGYATAPDYAQQLIYIIEKNHLFDYDTVLQKLHGLALLDGTNVDNREKQTIADYVIVQKGDCIFKIARESGVEVHQLCNYNGITIHGLIAPGQKLYLKPRYGQSRPASNDNKPPPYNKKDVSVIPEKINTPKA